ncbi:acetyl-CoA carboxylase carboxyltransferase subunit alpha [Candidatus Fermentibacteria bacterium]|nr:acetyl-CoA carboxylase carboxyltransferase subunit alpha [Candidatus Fermentibacteria bacterium]
MIPTQVLDFERPLFELRRKIEELRGSAEASDAVTREVDALGRQLRKLEREVFQNLTPWQKVLLARHPRRPYALDYTASVFSSFTELHGDRLFGDDQSVIAGLATLGQRPVVVVGQQKGRSTNDKIARNFGMSHPEGYRKAMRMMELAARFSKPLITFVDTPGAYPGVGAEERGIAEAIARNLKIMMGLPVPVIVVVIGEGGSGGALGIAIGNVVLMLEYSIYSVISPEGCAGILFKDDLNNPAHAPEMAKNLGLTADDLLRLGVIDEIVPEPPGGAHADPSGAASAIREAIERHLAVLDELGTGDLIAQRMDKFARMGVVHSGK